MPFSRDALKGWRSHFPGHSRTGVDLSLWDLIALQAAETGLFLCAAAILVQSDAYLRPGELFSLTRRHLVTPSGSRVRGIWGIIVGLLEDGKPTKAGDYDDVVLFNSTGRSDVNDIIRLLSKRRIDPEVSLFSPLTMDQYASQVGKCADAVGLSHLHLTPHCLRHSGASHDAYHKVRSMSEIQTRGRWKAAKSVNRYKRPGRMLLSQSQVSASIWRKAIHARGKLFKILSSQNIC